VSGEARVRERELIASSGTLQLALPDCPKGVGTVIASTGAADLIQDVRIEPLSVWPDDRGYFLEIQRMGRGLSAAFPAETMQTSAALSYPNTIKAFHYHLHQTDCWTPAMGMLQVALVDLRLGSPTFGTRNTLYVGTLRPWQILIPPGIGHGYKVIGGGPAMLIYTTDRFYDPKDEGRIRYDDPGIQYDWETQHK
jgi:dTDP-4-dehydrorhamnose 3,5-epimerase